MHIYLYDKFLSQSKYQKSLANLEATLTDLNLNGRIYRLGEISKIDEIINAELKRAPKTIIIVGNDLTFNKALTPMAQSKIPLAIIPIGEQNSIAENLGITFENSAATLAARRILKFDLGIANSAFFIKKVNFIEKNLHLKINNKFQVSVEGLANFEINNFSFYQPQENLVNIDPTDGQLNLFILKKITKFLLKNEISQSNIPFKRLVFQEKIKSAILDDVCEIKNVSEINLLKNGINLIVNKNRNF